MTTDWDLIKKIADRKLDEDYQPMNIALLAQAILNLREANLVLHGFDRAKILQAEELKI